MKNIDKIVRNLAVYLVWKWLTQKLRTESIHRTTNPLALNYTVFQISHNIELPFLYIDITNTKSNYLR